MSCPGDAAGLSPEHGPPDRDHELLGDRSARPLGGAGCVRAQGMYPDVLRAGGAARCSAAASFRATTAMRGWILADRLDGVVLTGGEDVCGLAYGRSEEVLPSIGSRPTTRCVTSSRSRSRKAAWERRLPIFAICRGLQVLNVALGGTLIRGPDGRGCGTRASPGAGGLPRSPGGLRARDPDARLLGEAARALAPPPGARPRIGPAQVSGRAADGCRGGRGPGQRPFAIGVQWHPEEGAAPCSTPSSSVGGVPSVG